MAVKAEEIATLIEQGIPEAQVEIKDLAGDGNHYAAYVCSPAFKGVSRVMQHQMVYKALQGMMDERLHALAVHTSVPEA